MITDTAYTITVNTDLEYRFRVAVNTDDTELIYSDDYGTCTTINFGSLEELKAVGEAMVRMATIAKR